MLSLKLTARSYGWLEYYILIGFRPIFRGRLLVSGRVVFWGVGESLKVQKMRKFSSQANDCLKWFQQYLNNWCFRNPPLMDPSMPGNSSTAC